MTFGTRISISLFPYRGIYDLYPSTTHHGWHPQSSYCLGEKKKWSHKIVCSSLRIRCVFNSPVRAVTFYCSKITDQKNVPTSSMIFLFMGLSSENSQRVLMLDGPNLWVHNEYPNLHPGDHGTIYRTNRLLSVPLGMIFQDFLWYCPENHFAANTALQEASASLSN